jgi:nicotinate-nucleotide adenylyltransferase
MPGATGRCEQPDAWRMQGGAVVAETRLGIFGGTFDPVHLGHLIIAEEFLHTLRLDRVLFLPTSRPPHKEGQVVSPVADRVAMLTLAITGNPRFDLSLIDAEQTEPTYTADSLQRLAAAYPGSELIFLIGLDSLRDLPSWHEPERIVEQARLGVAGRPDVELDLDAVLDAVPAARGRLDMVDVPQIGISATDLRDRVRRGAPIRYQVPDPVERYIVEHGLYRAEPTGNGPDSA